MVDSAKNPFEKLKTQLQSPTPRKVRFASIREAWIIYLFFAILFGAFLNLVVNGLYDVIPHFVPKYGLPALATVLGKETFHTRNSKGYVLKVGFLDQNKINRESSIEISPSLYEQTKTGEKFPIHYIKWLPRYPGLDQYPMSIVGTYFYGIGVLLVFYICPYGFFWVVSHEKRFLTRGIVTFGTVQEKKMDGIILNYVFDGETYSKKVARVEIKDMDPNGGIMILVDPDKPRSAWVADETFFWKLS